MSIDQNIRLTVDAVVLRLDQKKLKLLLIQRKDGSWALPGGFVEDEEPLKTAVQRELEEETSIRAKEFIQFYAFGDDVNRDPRGHTVSVAHFTILHGKKIAKAASDAQDSQWANPYDLPKLAFDHNKIVNTAIHKLKEIVKFGLDDKEVVEKMLPEGKMLDLHAALLIRNNVR